MALDTSIEQAALKIAEILHNYARDQGWPPEKYRIFITVSTDWGLIHVTFVAEAFEGQSEPDQYKNYDDIMDYLENSLRDDPDLYARIGLVTRGFHGYAWFAN